ncbi:GNAT family N-acetyltransferase [Robertmurraya kyonggiensis]|uniref:GNAT family N-acetyltransferase n=1 Tax=Robertmurraya kyonggiensis TaxID=1037680 RepID=A0A4V5P0N8_9BACI|nr:GNAT family N-acetyltransferase [Robertmurraya kyonggiensis]TKC15290.1 GNAT family N-acetyltransferase [Robertmurraya kyonggiensis]
MSFYITRENNNEYKNHIHNELYKFNLAHFPEDLVGRYEQVNLYIKGENDEIRGGLLAEICWNWLEIHTFMIDEDIRRDGHGTKLLNEIETIARERNCDFIKFDTLSFQALGFYEKNGYQVYGSIDNVGREFTHYYLKKDLSY